MAQSNYELRNRDVTRQSVSEGVAVTERRSEDEDSTYGITRRLTIIYALAAGFTSANLSYSLPILDTMAAGLGISQAQVANVPVMAQAGNAIGLLMILPLADFLPRRTFTISLVGLTILFWLGICLSPGYKPFVTFTFLSGLFTPVTQLLLPLVSERSTSRNRAFNLSLMSTGPTLGIFIGRVISGLVSSHTSWRDVYWLGLGLQLFVFFLLLTFMPSYEPMNATTPTRLLKTYPQTLWSILTLYTKYPVLVQAALMSFSTFFAVSSFWTTVTFLLSSPPYKYTTSAIGLLGLIGLATACVAPLCGKYIVNPLGEPLLSAAVGKSVSLVGVVLGTVLGGHTIAGPVLQALLLDFGLTILQISNRVAIHPIEPQMRNRVNTAFVSVLYLGQLAGTKAGSVVYTQHGGWVPTGLVSLAVIVAGYGVIGLRGPNELGWVGWRGGWKRR